MCILIISSILNNYKEVTVPFKIWEGFKSKNEPISSLMNRKERPSIITQASENVKHKPSGNDTAHDFRKPSIAHFTNSSN